ncbi:MAG: OmpH family outer membrane protein [Pseudomonadota bacterium]
MNKLFMSLAGVGAVVAAAIVATFSGAQALAEDKAPVILVVDRAQLIAQSRAGKTIPEQAEEVRESVAAELEAEAKKLQNDIEKYQKSASLMSDEVRQKTEQELAMRQQYALPQRVQIMDQAFRAAVQNAETKILIEARPILKDIVDDRGATILIDRSAVMYASVDADITEEVIEKLDKKMKSVEVQKISLAEVEKQIQELQAQQAENQ